MDVHVLSKLPYEASLKVVHQLLDRLLGVGLPRPNYSEFSKHIELSDWLSYVKTSTHFLLQSAYGTIQEDEAGDIEGMRAIKEVVSLRSADLKRAVSIAACQKEPCYLMDFDWELVLVVGSDKVTSIDEPAVTVSLDTQTQQSGARRYEVEFDSEQLNAFIDQLESVNKELMSSSQG